jgi:uncharacterized protein YegL
MTTNNPNLNDIQDLFANASGDGLGNQATGILVENLDSVALAGCSGADLADINTDDVTLVAAVVDASASMSVVRQAVIEGFNTMLDTFKGSKQSDSILVSAWSFNNAAQLHFSYTPAPLVKKLAWDEYNPDGGTALYDSLLYVMAGMVAYGQTLRNNGIRTRGIIIVFSDGDDNCSRTQAYQVNTVSQGLLAQEIYSLAYAGFGIPDPVRLAAQVGFPLVIPAGSGPSEIRRIFQQVSASVIRVSQANVGGSNSFFTV